MSLKKLYEQFTRWFLLKFASNVHWKLRRGITDADRAEIKELLKHNYYVILTHRRNHLTTYLTSIANFLLTGKFGFWAHTLMNLEDEVNTVDDFRLIEAVSAGVTYTPFDQVFDVDAVTLLKPKHVTLTEWTSAMDASKTYLGHPYDTLFDLANDNELSCVEVVHDAISKIPGYKVLFPELETAIAKKKNLTPQMFYDCGDFEVAFEVRR